jgi:hypothetical protein
MVVLCSKYIGIESVGKGVRLYSEIVVLIYCP